MAASLPGSNSPFHLPQEIRKKKLNGQQKREALEREVNVLQTMLDQEEKTREILEHVHEKHDGSAVSIPNFLPPKMKELLVELATVEGEIARMETHISQLQNNLKQEQESTKEAKSRQRQMGNHHWIPQPQQKYLSFSNFPPPSPMTNKGISDNGNEKIAFETKALHFINKAIKGDHEIGNFSNLNEKVVRNSGVVLGIQKENDQIHHQESKGQEKAKSRRSGAIKSPSPLRDSRHSSPMARERITPDALDLPPKSLSSTMVQDDQNAQHWHPNRLSENIMKCLNFVYVRLLRITRAMELEKSGPISRSMQFSLGSRSFRADPIGSNSKSLNLAFYKESRQQDPYGVFDVEGSISRDIGPYKNLVIFTSSSMDPKCISSSSSISLIRKLRVLMSNLQTVDLRVLSYQQKLAFWINMYNACIMHGFLQHGVPNTPEKMLGLMNKATLNIGGNIVNAKAIEDYILRKPTSKTKEAYQKGDKEDKETVLRKLFGVESMDPNIIFALSCGTRSSPAVRIYTGDGIVSELEKSKLEYLQASVVVTGTKRIGLPELLVRHMSDLAAVDMESLVEWVCHQLPTSGSLRKSMVDCFRRHNSGKVSSPVVEKIPYDYEFQYLLAI